MKEGPPEFRNLEQILAAHEALTTEVDALLGDGSRDDERPRASLEAFRSKVEVFLDCVARSGVWLYYDTDRVSAVSQLSSWVNELYRLGCYRDGERPPTMQLAAFAPERQTPLQEEDFPYAADAERGAGTSVTGLWDRHVKLCLERLSRPPESGAAWTRLLVIAGAPGSGRSSLLDGAFAPALARTPLADGAAPVQPLPAFMPGRKPLTALAANLTLAGLAPNRPVETLAAELLREPALLAEWLRAAQPPRALLVDRLEELFTLGAARAEQEAFVEALRQLASDARSGHAVVAVFDSEYTGRLAGLEKFFDAATRGWVGVNLDPHELRQLIVAPARRVGLLFEEGLAEQLVADLQGDPAAITLVQFTLRRLWQRRERNKIPWTAYQELCSGRLALDLAATETLGRCAPEDAPDRERRTGIVRAIFLSLVRPEAGGGVRVLPLAPVLLEERVASRWQREGTPLPPTAAEIHAAVEMFRAERLLTRNGAGEITLTHEALVTRWRSLVEWLDVERGEVRHRAVLRTDAEHWDAARTDPKRARGLLYSEQKLAQWGATPAQWRQAADDPDDPGPARLVREFLESSEAHGRRERRGHLLRWAAAIAAVIVGVGVLLFLKMRHDRERYDLERKTAMSSYVNRGSALLAEADPAGALLWFAAARAKEQKDSAAAEESTEAHAMSLGIASRQLPGLAGFLVTHTLIAADLSPAGDRALLALRRQGERTGGVWLWPIARSNQPAVPLASGETSPRAVFSADGLRAALALGEPGGDRGALEIWDVDAQPPVRLAREELPTVISDLAFHPGRSDLVAACDARDGERGGGVALYEWKDGEISIAPVSGGAAKGAANCLVFSPGGDRLAVGYTDGEAGHLRVFDLEKRSAREPEDDAALRPVTSVSFSPDAAGAFVAAGSTTRSGNAGDARIYRCDRKTTGVLPRLGPPLYHSDGGGVTSASFSPAGTRLRLLTTSAGGTAAVWDAGTGRLLARLPHTGWVFSAAWSPDGGKVATGSRDRTACLWDANSGELTLPPLHHGGTVFGLRFSPDGARLLTATQSCARVWETQPRERSVLPLPTASSVSASLVSDSGRIIAAAPSATRRWGHLLVFTLYDTLKPAARLDADKEVRLLAISAADDWVAAVNASNELLLWRLETGRDRFTWRKATASAQLPAGIAVKMLGFAGWENPRVFVVREPVVDAPGEKGAGSIVEIYDAATGQRTRDPVPLGFRAASAAASWDGARLAFGGGETRPRIGRACWFAIDATAPPTALVAKNLSPSLHDASNDEPVAALAFSPNGQRLVVGSSDDTVSVWNLAAGAQLWQHRHTADVSSVSFSGGGRFVFSTSFDSTAVVRDAETGQEAATVQHQGTVRSGAFSPDERYFATGGDDRTARIWDRSTGDLVAVLPHTCEVTRVSFEATQCALITFGLRAPPLTTDPAARSTLPRAMETRSWSILPSDLPPESFSSVGQLLGARALDQRNQQLHLLDSKRLESLWADYVKSPAATPADEDFHIAEARLAESGGDVASAAWHLRQRAAPAPDAPVDVELLADEVRVYSDVEDWDRTIAAATVAFDASDNQSWRQDLLEARAFALLQRGRIHQVQSDLEAALADHAALAAMDPTAPLWRTRQAEVLFLLGRADEALARLDEATRIKPFPGHFQKKAAILLATRNAALRAPAGAEAAAALGVRYEEVCKVALDLFGEPKDVASAAWCAVLGESAHLDLPALLPKLEATLPLSPNDPLRRNTLGALLYRIGGAANTNRAIALLTESSQLYERSESRQRRDPLAVDPTLPPGRPVDWIFLALAHARRAADAAIPDAERTRHRDEAARFHTALKTVLNGDMLDAYSGSRAAWNRLDLEILLAEYDRG